MAVPQIREGIVFLCGILRRNKKHSSVDDISFLVEGESVAFDELLRSMTLDIIRVKAHTHELGIAAEYVWLKERYPESTLKSQGLIIHKTDRPEPRDRLVFDVISFCCADGREKQVYFDITAFFDGEVSSWSEPSKFARKKIKEIYEL